VHWRGSHEESVQEDQQQKKGETQRGKVAIEGEDKDRSKDRQQGQAVPREDEEGQSCGQGAEQGKAARKETPAAQGCCEKGGESSRGCCRPGGNPDGGECAEAGCAAAAPEQPTHCA
jgi:hypothetical protein